MGTDDGQWHRQQAIAANGLAWELLEQPDAEGDRADDLLDAAHAASFHWARAVGRGPENAARAAWLLSRCHAVVGHGALALHHADRCCSIVAANALGDFDLAYAHEARARALACLGRADEAMAERTMASTVPIEDHEDRTIFDGDLASPPWFDLA